MGLKLYNKIEEVNVSSKFSGIICGVEFDDQKIFEAVVEIVALFKKYEVPLYAKIIESIQRQIKANLNRYKIQRAKQSEDSDKATEDYISNMIDRTKVKIEREGIIQLNSDYIGNFNYPNQIITQALMMEDFKSGKDQTKRKIMLPIYDRKKTSETKSLMTNTNYLSEPEIFDTSVGMEIFFNQEGEVTSYDYYYFNDYGKIVSKKIRFSKGLEYTDTLIEDITQYAMHRIYTYAKFH